MSNQKVYMIDGAMYEDIVRERVLLYSFVRHLAYQTKRLFSQRDIRHLQEVAHLYGEQAEEMFRCWDIPKRFLAFGDVEDLAAIKRIELLDYEDEEESGEAEDDWEEKFFQSLCDPLGSPKVVVMELDKILGKSGEQNKFSHSDPAGS